MWPNKASLNRITDGKEIIPEIEGLRFVSVILVILSHINNILLKLYPRQLQYNANTRSGIFLEECGAGVQVFFFISGFILAVPFLQAYVYKTRQVSVKHYYYRRLTRIEPPYLISLIIFLFTAVVIMHQPLCYALEHFSASALYIHNIAYNDISRINPVAWSLEIEVQFYLLFPAIASLLFINNQFWRRCLLLLFYIATAVTYSYHIPFFESLHLSKSIFAYFPVFISGILAAEIFLSFRSFLTKAGKNYFFDAAGIMALYFCIVLSGFQDPLYKILVLACYLILFASIFKGKILNKLLTDKWVVIIGGMCYSIYLVHYAVIYFMQTYLTHNLFTNRFMLDVTIQTVILLPVILLVSTVFFILFERPFMNIHWPEKWRQKMPRLFKRKSV